MKSFATKLLTVCTVGLLLLITGMMLRSVVNDRLQNQDLARTSITQSLAGEQTISGVSLIVNYTEHYREAITDSKTKVVHFESRTSAHTIEVLPDQFDLKGRLGIDKRHRGLFRVNGYVLNGSLKGSFPVPSNHDLPRENADSRLEFTATKMILAVSDPRGLRKLEMKLKDKAWAVEESEAGSRTGAQAAVANIENYLGQSIPFDINLELVGTDSLNMVPLGRESTATLSSDWPHPSFGSRFLPLEHSENNAGFKAKWRVSAVATNARSTWVHPGTTTMDSFSVSLIDPVDIYVMSDRAGKYANLFIAITLGGFLLFELLRSLRLHPLHYLLVGAALLMFFLLLLALSERLGFGQAYAIAASACVLLIGTYSINLLRSKWLALGFTVGLGSLYGALYVILLSEQNALLMGSLLIFALLAAVMLGTRKVDWHTLLAERPSAAREIEEHQYE